MTEILLKRYPRKVDKEKRKEYTLEFGQEAYLKKEPRISLEMRKVEKNDM